MLLKPWCAFKTELRNHHDTHYSRSGCVWFLLLLIIKNKKCCWSHGVLSKRNWGTIMIPISWYGKHVNWSTIAAQLPFQSKSTVLENMSIQWKTCQGWTSRYIFVDMLTKCQLLVILVRYHPSGQVQPSLQLGGPRISLTSTFGKVIFILKSDLGNWVNWFILVYYWLMTAPMYRLSAVLICVDVCWFVWKLQKDSLINLICKCPS